MLEHLFSIFFNARRKNGEGCEPATVSSFQPSTQRYLIYSRTVNEFEKSRKVLAAKPNFPCSRARQRKPGKPQAAQAGIDKEDALFEAGEFGDLNPVALQRTM